MHRSRRARLSLDPLLLLFVVSACSSEGPSPNVSELAQPLVAGCTVTATTMTAIVKDGESALVSFRSSDSMVTVNGNIFNGAVDTMAPCEIGPTATLSILADTAGGTHNSGRTAIIDYRNGLFMLGAGATAKIRVDFTLAGDSGTLNALRVTGSDNTDLFTVGAGTGTGASAMHALNANAKVGAATTQANGTGGVTVTLDTIPDVTFKNVAIASITGGAGDDRLDASGLAGVGTAYPKPITLNGGDGDDVIVGGLGADSLSGGLGADTLSGCQGDDTYVMGSAASGADIIAQACTTNMEGNDTLDYSARKANLVINLSKTLTATNAGSDAVLSGQTTGDGAHISDKIPTIKLGAGDDTINIPATSTVAHKVSGGPGDDTLNGGAAADSFDGETGDDTCTGSLAIMDYSARTNPVTATMCSTGCTTSDANDGDQSATGSTHTGTGATTSATGGITLAALSGGSGFTAASVGNTITLSACAGGATDQSTYPIVGFLSTSSVQLDVSAVGSFVADTCNFSEARSGMSANTGTAATVGTKRTTGSVSGLDHTANMLGHTLTLTHTASTTGGATSDDGAYPVVKVLSASSVAIDQTAVAGFAGGVDALAWSEAGPERDDVRCGQARGGTGNDMLTGDARANTLRGGGGDDTLMGGSGNDTLFGEAGADSLYGGAGADTLYGGGGTGTDAADALYGGDGADILEGDTGPNTFVCDGKNTSTGSSGTNPGDSDIVVDYSAAGGDTRAADCEF
jgi:Ca2+-binding RTX toxin-like protein